jgi:hypothetical protein
MPPCTTHRRPRFDPASSPPVDSAGIAKRLIFHQADPSRERSPYPLLATQEIKTIWHPIETTIGEGAGY